MIVVQSIDHVVLRTTDLSAMLHFYQRVLGCPIERTLPDLGLTQLRAGESIIDLVVVDSELDNLVVKLHNKTGVISTTFACKLRRLMNMSWWIT